MSDITKIILDCDPGHDDAVAIMLAAGSPKIELLGITTESGNQTIEKTSRNALKVLQWIGRGDIPVYMGCKGPMVREKMTAADIHGETGLDGPAFPEITLKLQEKHAVQYIVETLMASDEPITMVTTGPMTNLGMAIRMEPAIVEKIDKIVLMGGSYQNGNVTPAAEFNIICDPEAAYVCFTCGRPVYMMGLDITRKVLCVPEVVERMKKIGNKASDLFVDLMAHFCRTQKEIFGFPGGPLHDPCTIVWLIAPDVIALKPMHTTIDISRGESYGRTNCDFFNYQKKPINSNVAVAVDVERYWDVIEEELRRYGA